MPSPLYTFAPKRTAIYEVLTQQEIKAYFQSNKQQIKPKYPIKEHSRKELPMVFFQRTNWKEDGEFLIRVASLLEKGFSLDATISYLSITSPKYRKRYEQIITSLANGNSFPMLFQKRIS